jgi:hypothetical protein
MRRRSGTVFLGVFVSVVAASAVIAAGFVSASGSPAAWQSWVHLPGVLDLAGPRTDGRFVVAARGRLMLLAPSGALTDFTPAYSVPQSPESYISLSPGLSVTSAGCGFGRDLVFALDLRSTPPGVSTISAAGVVSHLASVHGVSTLSGITIDTTGDFGLGHGEDPQQDHRLRHRLRGYRETSRDSRCRDRRRDLSGAAELWNLRRSAHRSRRGSRERVRDLRCGTREYRRPSRHPSGSGHRGRKHRVRSSGGSGRCVRSRSRNTSQRRSASGYGSRAGLERRRPFGRRSCSW